MSKNSAITDEEFLEICNSGTDEEIEESLKNGADPDARDEYGWTALFWIDSPDSAEILLRYGADVNARDNDGNTPLHFASADMAEKLLDHDADVSIKNNFNMTALDRAIYLGYNNIVEILATKTALNERDENGMTILHGVQDANIVYTLVLLGADVHAKDNNGDTPLDIALRKGWSDVADVLRSHGGKSKSSYSNDALSELFNEIFR